MRRASLAFLSAFSSDVSIRVDSLHTKHDGNLGRPGSGASTDLRKPAAAIGDQLALGTIVH